MASGRDGVAGPTASSVSPNVQVAILAGAGSTVALMQTLVVPLVPSWPRLLHTSQAGASWIITVTLLTAAVTTPVMGRLGDMFGKRLLMLVCTLAVATGSLVCALGSGLTPVIIGRGLQGCGFALIPLGMSLMRDTLPPERLGSSVALMSSSLGIGGAAGLPLSAAIAQSWGWRTLFWTALGIAALFLVLIATMIPESPVRTRERVDVVGVLGLSAVLLSYLLAISQGGEWGWRSPRVLGLFAFAAVGSLLWGRWELRTDAPVVNLRINTRRPVLATNLSAIAIGVAMYAMNLLTPRLLQLPPETGYGLGFSLLATGLLMIPGGMAMVVVSQLSARLSAARGPRASLLLGTVIMTIGNLFAQLVLGELWGVLIFSTCVSIGVAFTYAAMPTIVMSSVEPAQTGAANGLNALARSLGTSTSSAVTGAVLGQLTTIVGGSALPSEAGVRVTLGIGALAAVLAGLLALFVPRMRRPADDPLVTYERAATAEAVAT